LTLPLRKPIAISGNRHQRSDGWPRAPRVKNVLLKTAEGGTDAPLAETRASAITSGPRFHLGETARMKLQTKCGSAPNEENWFLLPDRLLKGTKAIQSSIQPFDLMSRRHPLSSAGAFGGEPAR